jgi:HD-GYP domain-containing protein (c-di-GMP phosphodiesterase class II)
MFVAELDRPWLGTPFPLQGFLVVDGRQLDELRIRCAEVVVDRRRSAGYSLEHLGDLAHEPPRATWGVAGRVATIVSGWVGQRAAGEAGAIRRRGLLQWWEAEIAPRFRRNGVARPGRQRLACIPDDIELVTYHDAVPIEEAIGPAREVYRQIEATMGTFMTDLAAKREISAEVISVAASELVESIAANSEAMIWLARMHEQNVRTYTHGVEVAIYMVTLGRHLGFPRGHLKNLCMTGLLLDVGVMRIDNALLEKAGPLTASEVTEIRRHVDYSLDTLPESPDIGPRVREGIAQHHERIDGSGYPRGLTGEQMSIIGRMAGIADTFAALTGERAYAEPESVFNAMKILFNGAGEKFHEPLVEQFVQAIGLFPVGTLVELSTGEVAAVVSHNKVRRLQPRVLVLTDGDKEALTTPYELNLLFDPKDADGRPVRIWRGLPANAHGIDLRSFFLA